MCHHPPALYVLLTHADWPPTLYLPPTFSPLRATLHSRPLHSPIHTLYHRLRVQRPSTCPSMRPSPVPTCIHASVLPHPAMASRYSIPVCVCSFSFLICPWGRFALSCILHMGRPSPTAMHNLPNMRSDGRDSWWHTTAQAQDKWGKGWSHVGQSWCGCQVGCAAHVGGPMPPILALWVSAAVAVTTTLGITAVTWLWSQSLRL